VLGLIARLQVLPHWILAGRGFWESCAEELLLQADVLGVLDDQILLNALDDVPVYLAARVVSLVHRHWIVLNCQVVDHDAARLLEYACVGILRGRISIEVLVDLNGVIVEVPFELSEVADFLFVIVSLTHAGVSLRDVPSEC
jgi:hypothetical protein